MDRAEELVATARLGDSARWEVVAGALPGDLRRALVRRRGSRAAESRTMQHYVRTYVHTRFESEFVGARSRTTVARPVYLRHYVPRGHTYVPCLVGSSCCQGVRGDVRLHLLQLMERALPGSRRFFANRYTPDVLLLHTEGSVTAAFVHMCILASKGLGPVRWPPGVRAWPPAREV